MSKSKWESSLFRLLIQHLRVPELVYPFELGSSEALVERKKQTALLIEKCRLDALSEAPNLVEMLNICFNDKGCFAQANNLAFCLDRVFDVWIRKSNFSDELSVILSNWRFLIFKFALPGYVQNLSSDSLRQHEQQIGEFIKLMDSIGRYALAWSPNPKRSKRIFLDHLDYLSSLMDGHTTKDAQDELFDSDWLSVQWLSFLEKQKDKVAKITERLIQSETQKNHCQFSLWLAFHYLNIIFKNRSLPKVVQNFLSAYWVYVVAQHIEKTLPDHLNSREAIVVGSFNAELDQCCKNIVRVFCHKGESGFQVADQLIDDLQEMAKDIPMLVSNSYLDTSENTSFFSIETMWQELSESLLARLQDQLDASTHTFVPLSLPEHLNNTFGGIEQFKANGIPFEALNIGIHDWFDMSDQDEMIKMTLVSNFAQSQQLLFSNYLGMKAAQLSYSEFQQKIQSGQIKKLAKTPLFSSVFDQAVKGLSKIAENQKAARLKAAEKAKAEAEKLLEDRQKAELLSQERAQEIAERTKQMLAKRADKARVEKESAVLALLKSFNLGAWVAIHDNGEAQRFKLVVKLAATGKYVFVDRLGIKKREFLEQDLVNSIVNKQIEILSDGAEFEDSLERVVSRLRLSK